MMANKFQLLFILGLTTATCAKIAGYDYQPTDDLLLQKSTLAYTPQVQRTYLPPAQPQYSYQQQLSYAPVQETYKKEFYIFSAPEEDFEDVHAAHKIASAVQKNLRVLFIRTPEQKALEHAALQLAKQVSEDKTAIYVLNKQHDVADLAQRLTAYREQYVQKPEVHFVKYRTAAEAEHAQQQIQEQYNLLRGSTHSSNEGAARVLDFASKPQLPSYGSAISIVPAYNTGSSGVSGSAGNTAGLYNQETLSTPSYNIGSLSNSVSSVSSGSTAADLYTQQLLSNTATEPASLALQQSEYEKAAAQLAAINLLNAYKAQTHSQSQSFHSNSISSSNTGSYSSIGAGGGVASYGATGEVDVGNLAGLQSLDLSAGSVDNGAALASALEAYGVSPRNVASKQQFTETAVSKLNERQSGGAKLTFPSDGGLTNTYLPPIKRRLLKK